MNPYKKLLGNSALFAIGNLGSKLISIILVPLYTYYLSTSEYGTVDLVTTTTTMLLPIVSLSVYDAVLRFVMEKNQKVDSVLSNALLVTILGTLIIILVSPLLLLLNITKGLMIYLLVILALQPFQTLLSQFTRAIGQVKVYAFNGILMTIITSLMNILLLVYLQWGVEGYLLSIIVSSIASMLYLSVSSKAYKYVNKDAVSFMEIKDMLTYSIPLIPNAFIWWLINASNRYFIFVFVGATANGLFAVANKIPNLLSVLSSIFFQAWQLSAIEEFDAGNKTGLHKQVFKYFYTIMFIGASFILIVLKPILQLTIEESYYQSWKIVPFLLLGVVFSSFSSFLGTNYIVAKQTKGVFKTSVIGGILSVTLNFLLVPVFGTIGASISTMISFLCVWLIRVKDTKKFVNIEYDFLNITMNIIIIFVQIVILYLNLNEHIEITLQIILFIFLLILNQHLFKLIKKFIRSIFSKLSRK